MPTWLFQDQAKLSAVSFISPSIACDLAVGHLASIVQCIHVIELIHLIISANF